MKALALFLGAALLLGASSKPAPSPKPAHHSLTKIVTAALDAAPSNFAALRGKRYTGGGDSEVAYYPSAAFSKLCTGCTIRDDFGSAKTHEYWAMNVDWTGRWTVEERSNFIVKTFTPFKKRFLSVKVGQTKDGETTIDFEGKNGLWMYLETYGDSDDDRGFTLRVGHTLSKSVHLAAHSGPMTPSERTQFADAITNIVRTGVASAGDNFSSLLGKVHSDKDFHDANVSFGPMIENPCDISAIIYDDAANANRSKYIFDCSTIQVGGEKADILELARSTVYRELPSTFSSDTDPQYLMDDDYRYDNGANTSVTIKIEDGSADRYSVTISVYRFVPNP
ncbi:MAG TPA: hypothetical protein VNF68_14015 [Candidatus Baltobacteraceae bacterium]|nr:hypothetical protein [Candidatus Baltobacteraceae bacterium]